MKHLLSILLLLPLLTNGATYYFSQFTGDDTRSAAQAQNSSTPWKTLSKLTTVTLAPGDFVYLQRGGTYTGSVTINTDGTNSNRITFTAYGTGAKPIISGFYTVPAWTNLGSNIWESTAAVSTLSTLNMVSINGVNTAMGRYPNSGYFTYTGHSGNVSITSASTPSGTTNWTGAEAVIRKYRWIIDRDPITGHSGNVISFANNGGGNSPQDGYGFFIQNDVRTLDVQNEWFYNTSTKKIRIYSTSAPTNVKVATIEDLVTVSQKDYITFDNIAFEGANRYGVYDNQGQNNIYRACDFSYIGATAIFVNLNAPSIKIENGSAKYCNDAGFYLRSSSSPTVQYNTLLKVGIFPGMGRMVSSTFEGITSNGDNGRILYNSIDSVGYLGIKFAGSGTWVKYNYVNVHNFVKDDGGGIYSYPLAGEGATHAVKRIVQGNIVLNGIGAAAGTGSADPEGHGIYIDGADDNVDLLDNTVGSCKWGLFFNNNRNSTVTGNTTFDCDRGLGYKKYLAINMDDNVITNNIFVAKQSTQHAGYFELMGDGIPADLVLDNNIYARPIDDDNIIRLDEDGSGDVFLTKAQWSTFSSRDEASTGSPLAVDNVNKLRLEYNNTGIAKTVSLGAAYKGMDGTNYAGTITLQPYTAKVLILNGAANASPVANAGTDKVITLPVNSAAMNGSATDPDGTITTYSWAKTAGPAGGTIQNPAAAVTNGISLVQGTYTMTLTVTDNDGATDTDVMTITVNAAANQSPVSIPGANQTITLPTSTVNLVGSGTDSDGTISGYLWTQTGGTTATITTPTTASTSITGLSTQGVRTFNLRVTDNLGATGNATLQVTVNAAIVPPTANAGSDKVITLPANSAALNGSGTGTGISYLWTKISGPAGGTITSSTSAVTSATGLLQGVYTYELKVTDVNTSFATDQMTITVNAAAPGVPPDVRAGANMTVTLPVDYTVLVGTATASSGTIVSTLWSGLTGPNTPTISAASSLTTNITGLIGGTYTFELRGTDSNGLIGRDTVTVTVNPSTPGTGTSIKFFQAVSWPNNRVNMGWDGYVTANTKNFEIEKAFSGVFKIIGMVMPNKDPNDKDYWFTQSGVKRGTHKYRIKGNDLDGKFVYSPVVTVKKN